MVHNKITAKNGGSVSHIKITGDKKIVDSPNASLNEEFSAEIYLEKEKKKSFMKGFISGFLSSLTAAVIWEIFIKPLLF